MVEKALIIGSGISGSIIARELAETGAAVTVLEKRNHPGGNVYDHVEKHGFLVSKYGPHAFHTSDSEVYEYIKRFESWKPYRLKCGSCWDGIYTCVPFNYSCIDSFFPKESERLKKEFDEIFGNDKEISVVDALQHDNADVRAFAEFLFKNDYAPYTAKQWNVNPEDIDPSVLKRVPLRFSYKEGYFNDKYQLYPEHSYSTFISNILNHKNIVLHTETDGLDLLQIIDDAVYYDGQLCDYPVVYTGPADELFGCDYGRLPYRSLRFEWKYEDKESLQDAAIVAYPKAEGYTRITEYKKIPEQNLKGTVYAAEYPVPYGTDNNAQPYYPVLTDQSIELYKKYKSRIDGIRNLYCCGRLGDFQYYNMDQAIKEALKTSRRIVGDYADENMEDSLIIVMPAYNEEGNIRRTIAEWLPVIKDKKEGSFLIVNCSGSKDNTFNILKELKEQSERILIMTDSNNSYRDKVIDLYDYAVKLNPDYVFLTDSDGQTSPDDFPKFWADRCRYDAIIGARSERGDGLLRLWVEKAVCLTIRLLCRESIPDANAPFRLMKTEHLKSAMRVLPRDYSMPNIMLSIYGALSRDSICYKEISFGSRQAGNNSMNYSKIVATGIESFGTFKRFADTMRHE